MARLKIIEAKKNEALRAFNLELGKVLMAKISYSGSWSFRVKKNQDTLEPYIFFLAHAIVDKKIGAEVFEMLKN